MIFPLKNNRHTIIYFRKFKNKVVVFPKENYDLIMKEGTAQSKRVVKEILERKKHLIK